MRDSNKCSKIRSAVLLIGQVLHTVAKPPNPNATFRVTKKRFY